MKTICFFEGDMSRGGGTERMTAIVANELASINKYNILIISLYNKNNISYFTLNNKVKHISLHSHPNASKFSILKSIVTLKDILKINKVDVLINVDVMLGIFSIPAILFSKIKLISWEHFNYLDDIGSRYTNYLRKISIFFCKKYIVLTDQDEIKFKQNNRFSNKITRIYNTCIYDKDYIDYNVQSKIIISAGNMFNIKGFDMVVEIGKIVFDKHPDWKWYIYGDGVELNKIQTKIKNYKLDENIVIKSRTQEIERAYRESSIYVLTSRMESFGLVLLEAQSNNLPVVSFDIPSGPSEIIENNINGFLIKPFNVNDMAQKICILIEDENKRKYFSQHAKKNIYKFDIENVISQWQQIIDNI